MRRVPKRRNLALGLTLLAVVAIVGVAVAVTGGDDPAPPPIAEQPDPGSTERPAPGEPEPGETEEERERGEGEPDAAGETDQVDPHAQGPPRIDEEALDAEERAAARVVRAYVKGLADRDGRRVCRLLAPGAIGAVELPRDRGGCAPSLSASIGYRDPRGLPVWDRARVEGLLTVALEGGRASVTATTVTRFADRDEPSIEDDVIHLVRDGGRWRIAKPSSTLYRAVGIDDIPPHVLAPPE